MTVTNDNHTEDELDFEPGSLFGDDAIPVPYRVVDFIMSHRGNRVTTAVIAEAVGVTEANLNSKMRDWFNGNRTQDADFSHIHRAAEGIRAFYWYDPDTLRTEGAVPLRAKPNKDKPKKAQSTGSTEAPAPRAARRSKKGGVRADLFAQIYWDSDGKLAGVANDSGVLRPFEGHWLVPQVP